MAFMTAQNIFWDCLILLVVSQAAYPLLLFIAYTISQVRRDRAYLLQLGESRVSRKALAELPDVSVIVPIEYATSPELLAWPVDYPNDKVDFVFVHENTAAALNHAVARARYDILVFAENGALFLPGALSKLVRHFSNPATGAVCGAMQFHEPLGNLYERCEHAIGLMEARLGVTMTASGTTCAIRRACYTELPPDRAIEEFAIPMMARQCGSEIIYDPEAVAEERVVPTIQQEIEHSLHLAKASFRALPEMSRVHLHALMCIALFSLKLLRWLLPFTLLGLLLTNIWLARDPRSFFRLALLAQGIFYFEIGGRLLKERWDNLQLKQVVFSYLEPAMNLALLAGFFRYLARHRGYRTSPSEAR